MKRFLLALLLLPSIALADSRVITVAQTVAASAHSAGDAVGGKVTIAGAASSDKSSGVIHSVVITDLAMQAGDYDVIFFSSNPSATTVTDDSALDIADADLPKIVCVVPVTVSASFADSGVSYSNGVGCPFELANNSTSLYAAIVARSAPTYAGVSDVQIRVSILQD